MQTCQIPDILRDRLQEILTAAGVHEIGTLADVASGRIPSGAYLYVETGGPRLVPILRAASNGDVWTGSDTCPSWWCSCPDRPVYGTSAPIDSIPGVRI